MTPVKQPPVPRHPLFRAMVVMGGGVAIGCGGTTTEGVARSGSPGGDSGPPREDGGSGNAGQGGAGGDVIIVATGGTNPTTSTGGQPVIMDAGTARGGAGGAIATPTCPAAQYDCAGTTPSCASTGSGVALTFCACNANRPTSARNCLPGQTFVCRKGVETASGQALDPPVPFECSCVATPASCGVGCDTAFGATSGSGGLRCEDLADGSILCGCAFVFLR
jgi:hypothetical protein